jgi:hypothetical protein
MARHRGIVYERKGKEGTSNSQTNFPKVTTPTQTPIANLIVDLGSWIANAKVLVSVSYLLKIPSQKERLLQAIDPQSNKVISSNKVVPSNKVSPMEQEKVKEQHDDPPEVLTSRDKTRKKILLSLSHLK